MLCQLLLRPGRSSASSDPSGRDLGDEGIGAATHNHLPDSRWEVERAGEAADVRIADPVAPANAIHTEDISPPGAVIESRNSFAVRYNVDLWPRAKNLTRASTWPTFCSNCNGIRADERGDRGRRGARPVVRSRANQSCPDSLWPIRSAPPISRAVFTCLLELRSRSRSHPAVGQRRPATGKSGQSFCAFK